MASETPSRADTSINEGMESTLSLFEWHTRILTEIYDGHQTEEVPEEIFNAIIKARTLRIHGKNFRTRSSRLLRSTFFSVVYRIKVVDSLSGEDASTAVYALKFNRRKVNENHITRTRHNNKLLESIKSDHINLPIANFSDSDGIFGEIFEYAAGGTLQDYFQYSTHPVRVEDCLRFWVSMKSALEAIKSIHSGYAGDDGMDSWAGVHMDLKPSNLLVFPDRSSSAYQFELKLTDFGSFKYWHAGEESQQFRYTTFNNVYDAPEIDFSRDPLYTLTNLQSSDIWSLGCILTEAVVWSVSDREGLREFEQSRLDERRQRISSVATPLFHDDAKPLQSVVDLNARLHHSLEAIPIATEILLLAMKMLCASPHDRPTASRVLEEFCQVLWTTKDRETRDDLSDSSDDAGSSTFSHATMSTAISELIPNGDIHFAEAAFSKQFLRDQYVQSLCRASLSLPSTEVKVFRRALPEIILRFAQCLRNDATMAAELHIAKFISRRSRRLAQKIISQLHETVQTGESGNGAEFWVMAEAFLDTYALKNQPLEASGDMNEISDSSGEQDREETVKEEERTIPTSIESFIFSTSALDTLVFYLERFLENPACFHLLSWVNRMSMKKGQPPVFSQQEAIKLHTILEELHHVSLKSVFIQRETRSSIIDTLKGVIEDFFGERWDWWPLSPRMRSLNPGEVRLCWRCKCGNNRFEEVPEPFADEVLQTNRRLGLQDTQRQSLLLQVNSTSKPLRVKDVTHIRKAGPPQVAHPAAANTPSHLQAQPTQLTETVVGAALTQAPGSRPWPRKGPSTSSPQPFQLAPHPVSRGTSPVTQQKRYILYVLGGGYSVQVSYELSQLEYTHEGTTDIKFFQWLRGEYLAKKGFFKRIFGLRIFTHCDFYQFELFGESAIAPIKPAFPENHDEYEFIPIPMAPVPPIWPHEFYHRYYYCYRLSPHAHWFRPCKQPSLFLFDFRKIPMKKNQLDKTGRSYFWGLYAREEISALRVLVYNVVVLTLTLGFFFLWQFVLGNKLDLQNAAVPMSLVIGILALFWMLVYQDSAAARKT